MIDCEYQFLLFLFSLPKGCDAPFQFECPQAKLKLAYDLMTQDA